MFALHSVRLRHRTLDAFTRHPLPHHRPAHLGNKRHFVQDLCNGFLDLAVALPVPPSFPTYSTAIIGVTVAVRLALLPVSIWGKRRMQRIEELVVPDMKQYGATVSKKVLEQMKVEGFRGDRQAAQAHHAKKASELLRAYQLQLYKKHSCTPWPSVVVPALSQLPVFILFTIVLQRLSLDPTPFDSESFLTLTTLAHPDPTSVLPVVLGAITFANVESNTWLMTTTERADARKMEETRALKAANAKQRSISIGAYLKPMLRSLSIVRILIAMIAPGGVTLYWTVSAAFGLLQTLVMDWFDLRRRRRLRIMLGTVDGTGKTKLSQTASNGRVAPASTKVPLT